MKKTWPWITIKNMFTYYYLDEKNQCEVICFEIILQKRTFHLRTRFGSVGVVFPSRAGPSPKKYTHTHII